MTNSIAAVALVAELLLLGCGTLSAKPDPSRFFTLSALTQNEPNAAKQPSGMPGISLGVGPVTLPGYLVRQEIVVRVARNQLILSEHDRWAVPARTARP